MRRLFWYAVTIAWIDEEKAWIAETRMEDYGEILTIRTNAGDVLAVRPPITEEEAKELVQRVREIAGDAEVVKRSPGTFGDLAEQQA